MLVNLKIVWQKPKKATLFGTWYITTTPEKLGEIQKIGGDAKKVLQYLAEHKLINENKKEDWLAWLEAHLSILKSVGIDNQKVEKIVKEVNEIRETIKYEDFKDVSSKILSLIPNDGEDENEYLHKIGIVSEHRKLIRTYGKKYNKLNSMDTIKDINKLKGKDQKDAIERLMQQLTSTIKSM